MKYEVHAHTDEFIETPNITEDEYEKIKSAKRSCVFSLEIEEKFALLLDNYFEFETEQLKFAEEFRIWRHRDHCDTMLKRLRLDRRLVNILTSCRLYQDQIDHGISSIYGKDSEEFKLVKLFKRELYDNDFGYRFMEALRNYVQHAGLPVHIITHEVANAGSQKEQQHRYSVIPKSKVATFREDKAFKSQVLKELEEQGDEQLDLRKATRDYIDCFHKLHLHIRSVTGNIRESNRSIYQAALKKYSQINGVEAKFSLLAKVDSDENIIEEVHLVSQILKYYDELQDLNLVNPNLSISFATNQRS